MSDRIMRAFGINELDLIEMYSSLQTLINSYAKIMDRLVEIQSEMTTMDQNRSSEHATFIHTYIEHPGHKHLSRILNEVTEYTNLLQNVCDAILDICFDNDPLLMGYNTL